MKKIEIIISVLLALVMTGCYDPSDSVALKDAPEVITEEPVNITTNSVTFDTRYQYNEEGREYTSNAHVRISTSPDFSASTERCDSDRYHKHHNDKLTFSGLKPGTRYFYQYILSERDMYSQGGYHSDADEADFNKIITGEVKSFVTLPEFSCEWVDNSCIFATKDEQTGKPVFTLTLSPAEFQVEEVGICFDTDSENLTPELCMTKQSTSEFKNNTVNFGTFYSDRYTVGERIFLKPYFKSKGKTYYGSMAQLYIASGFRSREPFVDLALPGGKKWLMKDYGSDDPWLYGKGETWNGANYYSGKDFKLPSRGDYQELANCQIETLKEGDETHYKVVSPYNGAVIYMDNKYRWTSDAVYQSGSYYYYVAIRGDNTIFTNYAQFNNIYYTYRARYILSD